jgi:hypothetical protein
VPVHEVEMKIPSNVVLNADVVFEIQAGGQKLGELRVSRGTVDWYPANARNGSSLTWEQFDRLMRQQRG